MALDVADLENTIKRQAGELEIAKLQILSLQRDLHIARQPAAEAPAPNRAARRRKAS